MSEPSQRASRSRYSSPFATPQNAGSSRGLSEAAERPRTFMDKWIEPQLAPARPSFAEAGIERHGVVANMAALGTRPSAKVLKASTRPEPMAMSMEREQATRSSARRANQSSGSTPSEAISTPEPPINTIRRRSLSSKAETTEPQQAPQTPQTPQTPQQPPTPHTPQAQTSAHQNGPRPSPAMATQKQGQSVFALQQQSPIPHRQSMAYVPPPSQFGPNGEYRVDLDMTDRVVESAVQEALDNQRWPTAYALRTLYDDHRLNPRMVRLIDTIYNGRADENQLKEFKGVMRHKKKEGKKDRTGEYYFNGDGSDPLPGPSQFSPPTRTPSFSAPTGRPAGTSISASTSASASASPQKETEHISKKQRINRFAAGLSLDLNGEAGTGGHVKKSSASPQKSQHPHQNGTARTSTSMNRRRSASNTSSSSLSSVDEHILNNEYHHAQASRSARAEKDPGARQATRPISGTKETGPKTYTFPTVTASSSPSRPHHHHHHHRHHSHHHHHRRSPPAAEPSSPAGDVMAPGALLALAPSSSASNLPQGKGKKGDPSKPAAAAVTGRAFDENDPAVRMKRKAREITDTSVPVLESFERRSRRRRATGTPFSDRAGSVPPPPPPAGASLSSSSVPAKRTTLRLLNKKTTRGSQAAAAAAAAAVANYDSDDHSSPTLLSFQPDLAPGSVSASRAGTPSAAGRPMRKPKTGTGLRVKTS